MVGVPIRIVTRYEQPPGLSKRKFKEAMRAGHWAMAKLWYAEMLPLHFKRNAAARYGHKPRSVGYTRKKRKFGKSSITFKNGKRVKYGGEVDNVYTGDLERNLREWVTIRAFPTRATAVMHGPRYLTMRPHKSNHPDKAAELTEVTNAEQDQLEKELDRVVNEKFNAWRAPKTVST